MTTEGQSPSDWMAGLTTATRDGTQTPIRHGHGKLVAVDPQPIENSNGRMRLSFKFDNGEVWHATAPHPWPTAEFNINHAETRVSAYSVMGDSVERIMGQPTPIVSLIGSDIEFVWTKGHMMRRPERGPDGNDTGQWIDVDVPAMEFVGINGKGTHPQGTPVIGDAYKQRTSVTDGTQPAGGSTTPPPPSGAAPVVEATPAADAATFDDMNVRHDYLVSLIPESGMNRADWNTVALMDESIKAHGATFSSIAASGDAVLNELLVAGKIKEEDGLLKQA